MRLCRNDPGFRDHSVVLGKAYEAEEPNKMRGRLESVAEEVKLKDSSEYG